jgi:hypothetical protein
MKLDPNVTRVLIYITLWDEFSAAWNKIPDGKRAHEVIERFEREVGRLKNITEVCTDHQVWVKLEPSAKTMRGIHAEIARTKTKVLKIIDRVIR